MLETDIFVKTDAGRDEIRSRARGLSMPVRAILLMVDGQRSVTDMRTLIAGSKAPPDTLEQLLSQGLIAARDGAGAVAMAPVAAAQSPVEPSSAARSAGYAVPLDLVLPTILDAGDDAMSPDIAAERYNQLYGTMNEIVRDFLPAHRRYFFQLKIERCGTADELLVLMSDLQAALAKGRGDAFASDVIARLRSTAGY